MIATHSSKIQIQDLISVHNSQIVIKDPGSNISLNWRVVIKPVTIVVELVNDYNDYTE